MDDQSSDADTLVYALNETITIQDIQELKSASENKEELLGSWSELSPDLLSQVSKHLLDIDFRNFRLVCKSWHSNIPIFQSSPTLLDFPHSESSIKLMTLGMLGDKCGFFHPFGYNDNYHMDIPALLGARLHCSQRGWLLLSNRHPSIAGVWCFFFFHPFSMVKIELPNNFPFETMCFSSPPTSKDCFVVGIPFGAFEFGITRHGEESWNMFRFKRPLPESISLSNCSPILYKRKCYCLCEGGELGVFSLDEYLRNPDQNSFRWTHIVRSGFPKESLSLAHSNYQAQSSYLVENNGRLFAVFEIDNSDPCVRVFSLNPNVSRMKWQEIKTLGNRTFYVSNGGSFSEPAVAREVGDLIYLPNVQDNRCVFYSFQTKKCHSFFSTYSTGISTHGKEHHNCAWIKPTLATLEENFEW